MRRVALVGLVLLVAVASASLAQTCPPGSYSETGNAPCALCPPGKYNPVAGATECLACPADTFASFEGSVACATCPNGTSSAPGSNGCCTPVPCRAGEYGPDGFAPCSACPVGTFSEQGSSSCTLCEAGKYNNATGQRECAICPVGTYSQPGSTSCTPCSAGTYNNVAGQRSCATCPSGTFSEPGSAECTKCDPGTYASEPGSTECLSCQPGRYNSAEGQSQCYDCPVGRYSDTTGATDCLACDPGTYNDQTGQTECIDCAAGTFSEKPAAHQCTNCEEGTTSPPGATSCSSGICPAGTFGENGAEPCADCPAGKYSAEPGSSTCANCPPGKYSAHPAQRECAICPGGTYSDIEGGASCAKCPAGTYSLPGSRECTVCPEGTTSAEGSTECARTSIRISKIYDENADGDGAELAGWRARIASGGAVVAEVTLPADFAVASGTYQVQELMPLEVGWVPAAAPSVSITVAFGETAAVRFANACLGGGGAHAPGFWANKNGEAIINDNGGASEELAFLRSLNLRDAGGADFDPTTFEELRGWLRGAGGKNSAYALSAQLAALYLGMEAYYVYPTSFVHVPELGPFGIGGPWGITFVYIVYEAANADLGTNLYPPPGSQARAYQQALTEALSRMNANQNFVSSTPCPFTY